MELISGIVSNIWSESKTYNVTDVCIYDNKLWSCLTSNTNVMPTEGSYWTRVLLGNYARRWRFVGQSKGLYGANAISLPTDDDWDEVYVKLLLPTTTSSTLSNYAVTVHIPRIAMTSADFDGRWILTGSYISSTDNSEVILTCEPNTISLQGFYFAGVNRGADSVWKVYVR